MNTLSLTQVIENIEPKDPDWEAKACAHVESLAIPPWSLGQVLTLGIQLAGIQRTLQPCVDKKMILTMAADHGVAEEGVSAFP
ncbi:MAG: nicotinate-nucleotide--dimethylbenzimidazole phosphoribosyltransferase, partial [Eubacterium sp.]